MSGNKQDMQAVENAKQTSTSSPQGAELKKLCVKMIKEEQSKRTQQLQQTQQPSTRRNVSDSQERKSMDISRENAIFHKPSKKG